MALAVTIGTLAMSVNNAVVSTAAPNEGGDGKPAVTNEPVKGDPDGDPRDLDPLKTGGPTEVDELPTKYGSFENPPTPNGKPPKTWSPSTSGFDESQSDEIESLTTSTRKVYENPDGSKTAELTTSPVRFKDSAGEWRDFEPQLVNDGDTAVPESAPPGNQISTDPDAEMTVQASTTAGPVALANSDTTSKVVVDDSTVTYENAAGSSDLEVALTPTGFESTLVVPEWHAGGEVFEQTLVVPDGVTARAGSIGVELVKNGKVVGAYGSGVAWDDAATPATQPVVTSFVQQTGRNVTVSVSASKAWFDAPERRFPVSIDPTFTTWTSDPNTLDTFVASNSSTPQSAAVNLEVGPLSTNTAIKRRAFLRFDLSSIQGFNRQVTSAELNLWNSSSPSCTAKAMEVRNLTSAFSSSTVWSNQPSMGSTVVSSSFAKGFSSSCPAGVQTINVQPIVQDWMYATTNYGFGLKAASETDALADKTVLSGESFLPPKLVVTYNRPPSTDAAQTAPIADATVRTTQPTLKYTPGTDPDGDALQYWFAVSTEPALADGQVVASGWLDAVDVANGWTVPAGVLVDGQTYYWTIYTSDQKAWPAPPPATEPFTVDLGLGVTDAASEMYGPGMVNLATGNLVIGHQSRSFPIVQGDLGFGLEYNSQAPPTPKGLTGSYYYQPIGAVAHRPGASQPPQLVRQDPTISFDWGTGSPASTIPGDSIYAKWTGDVTVPTTGNYKFGGSCSDGLLIKINGASAFDRWSGCSSSDPDPWSGLIALTAGQKVPIEVEFWDSAGVANLNLKVRGPGLPTGVGIDLPAAWLTSGTTQRLPNGWSITTDLAGASQYRSAEISTTSVNLIDTAGKSHQYGWDVIRKAWQPPAGENGILTSVGDGTFSLVEDGATYSFAGTGQLLSVRTAGESGAGRTPTMTYSPADRLNRIEDPVSGKGLNFYYSGSGSCTAEPGFSTAPSGMLCAVSYGEFSGGVVQIRYNSNGQIARIDEPGSEITDFGYDGSGRINAVRDPVAADAVAKTVRANDNTTRSIITYDGSNRVSSIMLPEPLAGEARPSHSYTYTNATTTDIAAAGLTSSSGRYRRVTFDGAGRILTDTDLAGRVSSVAYDSEDRVYTSWDSATGLKSTTVFDEQGNVTDEWGPAPTSWWSSPSAGGAPSSNVSQTPHTVNGYDEGLTSLSASWFNSTDLTGQPVSVTTGVGHVSGAISASWGSGSPSGVSSDFSGLLTGWINIPDTGVQSIRANFGGKAEVVIDETLVVDGWSSTTGTAEGTYQGPAGWTPITIRYANPTGSASLSLEWHGAVGSYALVPGTALKPGYGLQTSTTDPDAKVVTYGYADPSTGNMTTSTEDPSSLALVTSNAYESSGLRRVTSRSLPLGSASAVTTEYYGATETRTVPCTGGAADVPQRGMAKIVRSADPSGSGTAGIAREVVADAQGRPAATRAVGDSSWSCSTFDARDRVISTVVPTVGSRAGRTTTVTYEVGGNPLVAETTDTVSGGTARKISVTIDLLQQVRSYTDAWNKTTTTTYDRNGRIVQIDSPAGVETINYDSDGNRTAVVVGGSTVATPHYDAAGRLSWMEYANGLKTDAVTRDDLGRETSWTLRKASDNSVVSTETVAYSVGGRVIDQSTNGFDPRTGGQNYVYDGAGRLTEAWTAARSSGGTYSSVHTQYGFGTASGSCASGTQAQAGKNSNRTSMVVGDGGSAVTTSYCYDAADRLVSTSEPGVGAPSYDGHGNTVEIWGETRGYDSTDRHLTTTKGTTTLTYERDATDRIISRSQVVSSSTTESQRLGYADHTDFSTFTMDTSGAVLEKRVGLPGGAVVLYRSSSQVWSIPGLSGDVALTTDASGTPTFAQTVDAYGTPTGNLSLPDNSAGSFDYGWMGESGRPTEHAANLAPTTEMGARQYDAVLGRFLEVDPEFGGSDNDYDYGSADPINNDDPTGRAVCSTARRRQAVRQIGYQVGHWKCRVYASRWYTLPKSSGWRICGLGGPAVICTKRLHTDERWVDVVFTSGRASIVVNMAERRDYMEMCINPAVLDELTKCGRAHVYSGTKYYCTISWEHVKIYGKSSGSRNCVKPTA